MIIVASDCDSGRAALLASFEVLDVSGMAMRVGEAREWARAASDSDREAVEAFVVGGGIGRIEHVQALRRCYDGPILAVLERRTLEETLELFTAGVDDVVAMPAHGRELQARVAAIRRRRRRHEIVSGDATIRVFYDGREAQVQDAPLRLRRRELRVLECLMATRSVWMTRSQIFDAVYGLCDDRVDETVVECHICRLRKHLKKRLGYDPIESQRFLGYRLTGRRDQAAGAAEHQLRRYNGALAGELVA